MYGLRLADRFDLFVDEEELNLQWNGTDDEQALSDDLDDLGDGAQEFGLDFML